MRTSPFPPIAEDDYEGMKNRILAWVESGLPKPKGSKICPICQAPHDNRGPCCSAAHFEIYRKG